jgi:uncharacterized protein
LRPAFQSLQVSDILKAIEGVTDTEFRKGDRCLLFLDEVQAIPEALGALRYFYEDMPSLPVVAAGSLLDFTLANHSFSMPVGRIEYLFIQPMSFGEVVLVQPQ